MKMIYRLAVLSPLIALAAPAASLPLPGVDREFSLPGASQMISDRHRVRKRRPVAETAPRSPGPNSGDAGGYVVNRYGFGNYVAGPAGFGGFPAGSADAQIWKQRQEWKCQNVPETC